MDTLQGKPTKLPDGEWGARIWAQRPAQPGDLIEMSNKEGTKEWSAQVAEVIDVDRKLQIVRTARVDDVLPDVDYARMDAPAPDESRKPRSVIDKAVAAHAALGEFIQAYVEDEAGIEQPPHPAESREDEWERAKRESGLPF